MNNNLIYRLVSLVVAIVILASPLLAQQRRAAPLKKPAAAEIPEPTPTFDSLLASESYKVYCEIRGVGGLIRSSAVNDLLDPVMKLGRPPKEFKTVVRWLNAHAEVLADSRMLVAGWPSRPKLPTVLVAIEFASPEDAKKFYPQLRDFLPTLNPTPAPTPSTASTPLPAAKPKPEVSAASSNAKAKAAGVEIVPVAESPNLVNVAETQTTPTPPPYQMSQVGSLVFISDTPFTFRSLRPQGSKALEEDQNFLLARNRFASEPLFLYLDLKSIEKEEKAQRQKWEEERKRVEAEAANQPKTELSTDVAEPETAAPTADEQTVPPPEPQTSSGATPSGSSRRATVEVSPPMMFSLYGALFGGESKWPEAIGAALVFEGDAYVVRTLIINGAENKSNAIPFVPQFVPGPPIVPESPSIIPADTDLFVSVSLDYPQIYSGMIKAMANAEELSRKYGGQTVKDSQPPESPFAIYEQKLGLKIKDDVLPLLGNEFALALPRKTRRAPSEVSANAGDENPTADGPYQETTAGPKPVIAISVKDREAVGRLIPKILEAFGLKRANLLAQTEKRDGTEIVSYAGVFSYAFIGDFLVLSSDSAETRHVVDAYLNHETLSSDSHFKNFTHWQPRQLLGQVYVAPGLVEQYTGGGRAAVYGNDKMNDFLSRVNPVIDPLTYALSNDGLGPLHELHVPKNLLQLIVAGASGEASQTPLQANEAMAQSALRIVFGSESSFQATKGAGRYATLDELLSESLINKELLENHGYKIEIMISGNKFEATAMPVEYGKSGRLSFFIDETGTLRAGDHGGGPASVADQPFD